MKRPDDYEDIQKSWSESRTPGIQKGARCRVNKAIDVVKDNGLSVGNVAVFGSQWGFEADEFRKIGSGKVLCVDCVPQFCEATIKIGFETLCCDFEDAGESIDDKWNVYSAHSLEHSYDLASTIKSIQYVAKDWIYINVPIELGDVRDKAHFSPVRSADVFIGMFRKVKLVYRFLDWSTKIKGDLHVLFRKNTQ